MLERKSKYLKSYTPGWYVLSPTHLHEFKSADRIYTQPPVMSLLLTDQKLGSRSQPGSSSHKFGEYLRRLARAVTLTPASYQRPTNRFHAQRAHVGLQVSKELGLSASR
jgi:hypothetical protein